MKKQIIKGCDARGDGEEPYLTRWIICKFKHFHLYMHKFHRSDSDDLHDHPWDFISVVLWRGYIEETFIKSPRLVNTGYENINNAPKALYSPLYKYITKRKKRIYPGQIIFRPATHAHRVELINNKPAYTLLINFGYVRQWGFFTKNYWQHFIGYFNDNKCNTIKTDG